MLWLERYGRLDLGQVLEPAISLARNGYPVSAELVLWLSDLENQTFSVPDSQRAYAREGVLPAEGDTIFMPKLADTFQSLVIAYNEELAESRPAQSRLPATMTIAVRSPRHLVSIPMKMTAT